MNSLETALTIVPHADLAAEIVRRISQEQKGLCTYCGQSQSVASCRMPLWHAREVLMSDEILRAIEGADIDRQSQREAVI